MNRTATTQAAGPAINWSDKSAAAIDALFAEMGEPGHPGIAYAVIHQGRVLHQKCIGLADVENDIPVTADTVFRLGSVTKHFCATALLILERRGALTLDDRISKHVLEVPACAAAITLRQLLTMTSGLQDGVALTIFAGRGHLALNRQEHLELIARCDRLAFPSGEQMHYSNSNYALLSLVVERVSGRTLRDFLDTEIFQPLGMRTARLIEKMTEVVPNKARGYLPSSTPGRYEQGLMLYDASGDGGLDMSLTDFLRWFANYRDDRLFGPDYRTRMEAEVHLNNGELSDYRLGIAVSRRNGRLKVHHAGGMPGYLADFCFFPELDLGVLLLTNWMLPRVLEAHDTIADLLTGATATTLPPGPPAGLYLCAERNMALQIVAASNGTECYMMGDRSLLDRRGQGYEPIKTGSGYWIREVASDGSLIVLFGAAPLATFRPWQEPADSQAMDELVGAYRSSFVGETHYITADRDGSLRLSLDSGLRHLSWNALKRRARDVFTAVIPDEPTDSNLTVTFLRDGRGRVTGLRYTTSRVRDLDFHRMTP